MDTPEAQAKPLELKGRALLEALVFALAAFIGGAVAIYFLYARPEARRGAQLQSRIANIDSAESEKQTLLKDTTLSGEQAQAIFSQMRADFKAGGVTGPLTSADSAEIVERLSYAECSKLTGKSCGPEKPAVIQAVATALPGKGTKLANVKKRHVVPKGKHKPAPKHLALKRR